jgi:ABC-type lipoprotein release transport system permease subunit
LRSRLGQFRAEVARKGGGAIPSSTPITHLLDEFTTRSAVVGWPILAMLALVVGEAIYFLVYTSALTVEREGAEIALLKSRGASSWQTVGIHLRQSFMIALIAATLAPFVARFLVATTGRIPPLSTLTGGEPLDVAQVRSIAPFVVAGGLLTFLAMGLAILPYSRKGILALRSLATLPATISTWQKYNIDVFAIALSVVLLLQLRLRGFINQTTGTATLDPLTVIIPALLLFTGALILLRVFPYLLMFVGWLLTKSGSTATALAGWHLGRNPVPYGRLALLVWVTTGRGAVAMTYASTLEQSYADRAAFAAGADVRVVGEGAGYAVVPDSSTGTPVLRTLGAPRQPGRSAEVLAIRPEGFSEVVNWRSDFGADTPEEIFSLLRPDGVPPDIGVEIPLGATRIEIDGIVVPQSLADEAENPYPWDTSIRVLARIIDARARVWTMIADADRVDSEWTVVSLDLTKGKNTEYTDPPVPPLTIASVWIERSGTDSPFVVDEDEVLFASISTVGTGGAVPLDISELEPINGLTIGVARASAAATARFGEVPETMTAPTRDEIERSPLYRDGPAVSWSVPESRTRSFTDVPQVTKSPELITVLLDREAAAIAGLDPGDIATFSIGAGTILGQVVGFIEELPTATDPRRDGVMVVDLDAINAWANGEGTWSYSGALARVDGPEELWVATDDPGGVVRVVVAQMDDEPSEVVTVGLAEAAFSSRPVQVGLVAILFVGVATGVVLALAGVTGYVLVAVARRAREMGTLRALGFERTSVGTTFALEQFVVIGLGALIGVLAGILLVVVMLPFFQLGESARVIEPSIVLSIPASQLVAYVALVGVLLIFSVMWATRKVSARRMSEILREVER